MATLPTVGADAGSWGTELNTWLTVAHQDTGRHPYLFNAWEYGVAADGTTDDMAALNAVIAAAIAAGGYSFIRLPVAPNGIAVSAPLSDLSARGIVLSGFAPGATWLKPTAGFSGAQIINITADYCGVRDLTIAYASSIGASSSGNPAANGIQVSSARYALLENLELRGLNGWAIQSQGGATVANLGEHFTNVHVLHCASGLHVQGDSGTSYGAQHWITGCNLEICDSGDNLFIEDCNDVQVTDLNGAAAQGTATNSAIHLKGACSSILFANPDVGVYPGGANAPTVLIETGTHGDPTGVKFTGGILQKGTTPLRITSGGDIQFLGMTLKAGNGDGTQITNVTGIILFDGCTWKTNGAGGGTCYDLNITSSASPFVFVRGGVMESPVGAGAGFVTNPVNDTGHKGHFTGVSFSGSGVTPSTVFASGGTPQIVRQCPGYNPRGNITAPTIGASPFTTSTSQHDVTIIFTAINTLTAFKIGGTAVGVLPVAGVPYHVPARQSLELDYSGAAPTWQWFAD